MGPMAVPIMMAVTALYQGYSAHRAASLNAKIAKSDATYQLQKGEADEKQHMNNLRKQMATGKVAAATSGVSLLSGSTQDVFDENLEEGIFDALMIRNSAQQAANSSLAKAAQFQQQGKQALIGSFLQAGTSLAGGLSGGGKPSYFGKANPSIPGGTYGGTSRYGTTL